MTYKEFMRNTSNKTFKDAFISGVLEGASWSSKHHGGVYDLAHVLRDCLGEENPTANNTYLLRYSTLALDKARAENKHAYGRLTFIRDNPYGRVNRND